MANIKDIDEIKVRKVNNGMCECSTMYGGYFRHHYYMGYTKAQAKAKFKKALEKGEL